MCTMTKSDAASPLEGTILKEMAPKAITKLIHVVYAVTNGQDILQIGKGRNGSRASKCMRGTLAGKHNKAFICAVYETITGIPNRYFAYECVSEDEADMLERDLHRHFGVDTNCTAACVLSDRIGHLTVEQVHLHVIDRLRSTSVFKSLSDREKQLAEQLFDLVAYGSTVITRTNRVVKSCQGDNLEGNILANCCRNHLIPVLQKLTDNYLGYGKHAPDPVFYQSLMERQFRYVVQGRPFKLRGDSQARRVDADSAVVDLVRMGLSPA